MNITKAKYYKDEQGKITSINVIIDGVDWSVPLAEDNRHYQDIQKWVADGNTIEEAD